MLECGHLYTLSVLDDHIAVSSLGDDMDIAQSHEGLIGTYYQQGADGRLVPAPLLSKFGKVPICPECRHPITTVKRYGRPVNKVLVDNSQQK